MGAARPGLYRAAARFTPELFSPPQPSSAAAGRLQADGGGMLAAGAGACISPASHQTHDKDDGALVLDPDGDAEAEARTRAADSAHNPTVVAVRREIRSLRQVIRSLEEELLKQKNEHQRTLQKRSGEHRTLVDEVFRSLHF